MFHPHKFLSWNRGKAACNQYWLFFATEARQYTPNTFIFEHRLSIFEFGPRKQSMGPVCANQKSPKTQGALFPFPRRLNESLTQKSGRGARIPRRWRWAGNQPVWNWCSRGFRLASRDFVRRIRDEWSCSARLIGKGQRLCWDGVNNIPPLKAPPNNRWVQPEPKKKVWVSPQNWDPLSCFSPDFEFETRSFHPRGLKKFLVLSLLGVCASNAA